MKNRKAKISLLIAISVFVTFAIILFLGLLYHDSAFTPAVHFNLTILPYGLLALFISMAFVYIEMCIDDKVLFLGILGIYLLSIFWIFIRVAKIVLMTDNCLFYRLIWYLYYLPMLFGPCLLLTLTNYIFFKKKKTFYIVTAIILSIALILFLLVITNDITQWVFIFDKSKPESTWSSNSSYTRTWIYYVIAVVIGLDVILSGVTIGYFTRKKRMLFAGTLYILCLLVVAVYAVCYTLVDKMPSYLDDMTIVYLLFISVIVLISSRCGLFISSGRYEDLFERCSFALRIDTYDGKVVSNTSYHNMDEQKAYREHVHHYNGQEFRVYEDVSNIRETNQILNRQLEEIIKNNEVLKKQKDILQEREIAASRKELNTHLDSAIEEDIKRLYVLTNALSDSFDKNDQSQREVLDEIYHLCNFIKRKSYLVLMDENNQCFTKESLQVFFKELLTEFSPRLVDYEVMVNKIKTMPIEVALNFTNFIYEMARLLTSSYHLFLVFTMKENHDILKIDIIDYQGDVASLENIVSQNIKYHVNHEDNVTSLVLEDIHHV